MMRIPMLHKKVIYLLLMGLSYGCQVGPKYSPPKMDIPDAWQSDLSQNCHPQAVDDFVWWEKLNDPLLNTLIERASEQNLDLSIAATRILQARAFEKGGRAPLYPHLDGSLTYGHVQYNRKVLDRLLGIKGRGSDKKNVNFFEAGFDAEWELDFFGVHAHELQALKAEIQASEENFKHILITLTAEVAKNYIEIRGFQERLSLLERNMVLQNETLNLTEGLIQAGFVGSTDQKQAQEQLKMLLAEKPNLQLSIRRATHRLSILLGYPPGELLGLLNERQAFPVIPAQNPVGIPSDLLRRRPDIRQAERNLAAATERVGSAIAALFPRLSLTGFIADIGAWKPHGLTGFGSSELLLPIFNSKQLKQDVDLNKIKTQEALYFYQKTVLEALEETENAIASLHAEQERNAHLYEALEASQAAYTLTSQLYQKGFKNYLDVLIASRSLLAAEEAYIQSSTDVLLHYIALYKALGGGWDLMPNEACASSS